MGVGHSGPAFIQPLELWQYFSGHTLSIRGIEGMETLYPTLATGTFAESARVSLLYGPIRPRSHGDWNTAAPQGHRPQG